MNTKPCAHAPLHHHQIPPRQAGAFALEFVLLFPLVLTMLYGVLVIGALLIVAAQVMDRSGEIARQLAVYVSSPMICDDQKLLDIATRELDNLQGLIPIAPQINYCSTMPQCGDTWVVVCLSAEHQIPVPSFALSLGFPEQIVKSSMLELY